MKNKVYRYYQTVNYLTIAQMYLKKNVLLRYPLTQQDVKQHPIGHWGASPGINMIIASILNAIYRSKIKKYAYGIILGTGHANASWLANIYLNGLLEKYYPLFKYGSKGIENLCQAYGAVNGFAGEMNSGVPGSIYDGGELGYALCISYGAVLHNPNKIVFTILGDGECETAVTSAAWNCQRIIENQDNGAVLPIINLNKYKMGSKSILSLMSKNEICCFFSAHQYKAMIVESWEDLSNIIESALYIINRKMNISDVSYQIKWPVVIFVNIKGGQETPYCGDDELTQAILSHKLPLKDPHNNKYEFEELQKWLSSYEPHKLFDENGFPMKDILEITNASIFTLGEEKYNLSIPDFKFNEDKGNVVSNVLTNYMNDILAVPDNQLHIFSPDELRSNGFENLNSLHSNAVTEVLNEHICQGLCEGYLLTGRQGIIISYESFMPIVTSMISQFLKFIYTSRLYYWRKDISSLIVLLTSVCWANTYSHQNPEFVTGLLQKEYDFVKAYYPIDLNTSIKALQVSLQSKNRINIITFDKRNGDNWLDSTQAEEAILNGFYTWNDVKNPDFILLSSGDYAHKQCLSFFRLLEKKEINLRIRYVIIFELSIIEKISTIHFEKIFGKNEGILYEFHGYSSTIKNLLFERCRTRNIRILGYNNKSWMRASSLYKMVINGASFWDIGIYICEYLIKSNHPLLGDLIAFKSELTDQKNKYMKDAMDDEGCFMF